MDNIPVAPLPKLEQEVKEAIQADHDFVDRLGQRLSSAGIEISDHVWAEMVEEASSWRVQKLNELGAAYLALALYTSELNSKVHVMVKASQPHPHGNTPRVIVFAKEFSEVVECAPPTFILPALKESERLNRQISQLQSARREADSAKATLQRIVADLSVAMAEESLTRTLAVVEAAEAAYGLAQTELKTIVDIGSSYPTEFELAASFYPISVSDPTRIRTGDTLIEPETKHVLYQHGNPRELGIPEERAAAVVEQLKSGETVLLRPLGMQGVLALRFRLVTTRLKALAKEEQKIKGERHKGRVDALAMALELLAAPAWGMPPVVDKAGSVAKDDEDEEGS